MDEPLSLFDLGDVTASSERTITVVNPSDLLNAKFRRFLNADGTLRVYAVNEAKECVLQVAEEGILDTLRTDLIACSGDPAPTDRYLRSVLREWRLAGVKLNDEPEAFAFADEDVYSFKRFDWKPEDKPFPAWMEFLERLSDPKAFMAFVGSCFDKQNRGRQLIWLRGDAQCGKSNVLEVLQNMFGAAATSINNVHIASQSRFLFSSFYGKKALFYPDCKNTKFGMSEIVRNLTSGDSVLVEFKNKTAFPIRMRMKLFIASNYTPQLTGDRADRSRLVLIEVKNPANPNPDSTWVYRLRQELPGFIYQCRRIYEECCPDRSDVPIKAKTHELIEKAVADFEEEWSAVFFDHFELRDGAMMRAGQLRTILAHAGVRDGQHIANFKEWLRRKYNIESSHTRNGDFYPNLVEKIKIA